MSDEEIAPAPQQPGVFVSVLDMGEGKMAVTYETVGGFNALAVPTLLELAQLVAKQRLGLI